MKNNLYDIEHNEFPITYIKTNDIVSTKKYRVSKKKMQDLMAERNSNGLCTCVRQIGHRYFIRKKQFEEWLDARK
jgi:hypothetical protein